MLNQIIESIPKKEVLKIIDFIFWK